MLARLNTRFNWFLILGILLMLILTASSLVQIVVPTQLEAWQILMLTGIATVVLWIVKIVQARTGTVISRGWIMLIVFVISLVLAVYWLWSQIIAAFAGLVDPFAVGNTVVLVLGSVMGYTAVIGEFLLGKILENSPMDPAVIAGKVQAAKMPHKH